MPRTKKPGPKGRPDRLTPLQEKFTLFYVQEVGDAYSENRRPNARAAALKAGYAVKTAGITASQLLRDSRVKARVDSEIDKIIGASREEMRYKLIKRLSLTGFSDISLFLDDENNVLPKSEWPEGASVAIKDVVNVPTPNGVRTEIKLKDDKHSQDLLIKLLTLVEELPVKIDLTVNHVSLSDLESGLKIGEE